MRQMMKNTKIEHRTDTTGNRILQYVDLTGPKFAAGKKSKAQYTTSLCARHEGVISWPMLEKCVFNICPFL